MRLVSSRGQRCTPFYRDVRKDLEAPRKLEEDSGIDLRGLMVCTQRAARLGQTMVGTETLHGGCLEKSS